MASQLGNCGNIRMFSTSLNLCGKRNFRKFNLYEKRPTKHFWKTNRDKIDAELELRFNRGTRPVGVKDEYKNLTIIPEMIPDIIVPDLEGFKLKPYVSYRVRDIVQGEFTPQDLFYAVYSKKINDDFKNGKLNEDGTSQQPSRDELLTEKEARENALKTGSDIYG